MNSYICNKNLELNSAKCAKIHLGKNITLCPQLMVNDKNMKPVNFETYLGDIIHRNTKQHATIVERKAKGYGIVANILALVREVPLGHRRVQVGLQLRQAWFLNGILFNSEIWQKITKKDMSDLCAIDHYL